MVHGALRKAQRLEPREAEEVILAGGIVQIIAGGGCPGCRVESLSCTVEFIPPQSGDGAGPQCAWNKFHATSASRLRCLFPCRRFGEDLHEIAVMLVERPLRGGAARRLGARRAAGRVEQLRDAPGEI